MILPRNGRIVIVDDSADDIKDFVEIFSKEGLSFSYFSGSVDTLPDSPLVDTFLMLLDLELDGSAIGNDATQASQVISVMERVLGDSIKDGSVVVIAWSKSLTILKELRPRMESAGILPLAFFEIDKLTCKTEEGHFDINLIKAALDKNMSEIPGMDLLYFWDNIAGQAAAEVYKRILPKTRMQPNEVNKRLNAYFEELAKAYAGKSVTSEDACFTIKMLNVLLANEIEKDDCGSVKLDVSAENKADIYLKDYGLINASINLASKPQPLACGSVHVSPCGCIAPTGFDIFEDKKEAKRENRVAYEAMRPIICEVSTLCDYAQGRRMLLRFVPGLLVPCTLGVFLKRQADYLYITNCVLCNESVFDGEPFYIVLDFRKFFCIKEFAETPELLFQVNESLLMHIQNRLGRHVSNPGVVFADHVTRSGSDS